MIGAGEKEVGGAAQLLHSFLGLGPLLSTVNAALSQRAPRRKARKKP